MLGLLDLGLFVLDPVALEGGPSALHCADGSDGVARHIHQEISLPAAGRDEPLAVPTWARAVLAGRRELRVVLGATAHSAPLLLDDADWRAFIERHHRPDLRGRRVAVLGGSRAPFERARQRLAAYGLTDCRRLPPAYEENRTKQETKLRLQNVELVIVCTNRMKHTDTDQLRSVEDELACAIVMLDTDTDAQIEKAVVEHFRAANEAAG